MTLCLPGRLLWNSSTKVSSLQRSPFLRQNDQVARSSRRSDIEQVDELVRDMVIKLGEHNDRAFESFELVDRGAARTSLQSRQGSPLTYTVVR